MDTAIDNIKLYKALFKFWVFTVSSWLSPFEKNNVCTPVSAATTPDAGDGCVQMVQIAFK